MYRLPENSSRNLPGQSSSNQLSELVQAEDEETAATGNEPELEWDGSRSKATRDHWEVHADKGDTDGEEGEGDQFEVLGLAPERNLLQE